MIEDGKLLEQDAANLESLKSDIPEVNHAITVSLTD